MEKENKILLFTEEAEKLYKKRIINKNKTHCFNVKDKEKNEHIKKRIQKTKHPKVYIFDTTYQPKEQNKSQHAVNDHINKTGKNILIGKNKKFIDLSTLYVQQKKGITTTGLGKRYSKEKRKHKNPSTDLCQIAIWCKRQNKEAKIYGILVNNLKKPDV